MFNCTMIRKKPSQIRYSQDSIAFYWKDNERPIGETLDQLLNCEIALDKIPKITVSHRKNILYTSDNRRLWVFKTLEKLGECETIWLEIYHKKPRNLNLYKRRPWWKCLENVGEREDAFASSQKSGYQ